MSHLSNTISRDTTLLPVMEQFYTLQGEGKYAGHAAYFIRLAGCDVGCVWCDVKESWEVSEDQYVSIASLVQNALQYPGRLVVITGGEPAMYDLTLLTEELKKAGFRIHIETSGAYPLSGQIDWVTVSPKKFKAPLKEVLAQAHELKVVVFNSSDFKWAEEHATSVSADCLLYLQVEWGKQKKYTDDIIEYVKNHPQWHLSLQTHKYLDIP